MKNITKIYAVGMLLGLLFTGCSKTESKVETAKQSATANTAASANLNTELAPVVEDGTVEKVLARPSVDSTVVRDPSKPVKSEGPDNSQILATYDGAGTLSEERYFQDSNKVNLVVVETKTDGTKTGKIFARDGKIKEIPQNMIASAMKMTDDELASSFGFTEFKKAQPITTIASNPVQPTVQTRVAPAQVPQKPAVAETLPAVNESEGQEPQSKYPQSAKTETKPDDDQQ
jgi:PBP1b-binding outer membrane lipoprotein LpoB